MTNKMRPIHPDEILRDELEELGYSAVNDNCRAHGLTRNERPLINLS